MINEFNRTFFDDEQKISFIGEGELGGKASSLKFFDDILKESDFTEFDEIQIDIPTFTVLRTDVFDDFMTQNDLYDIAYSDSSDDEIALAFQNASLPFSVLGDLRELISKVNVPLAIRSSSMLEDAKYKPFAGIYGTKMIPNNQFDSDTRFTKMVEGIKYVYASTFLKDAKEYFTASGLDIRTEKMAVIIQEIIGNRYGDKFYPNLSGVGKSYNYYPINDTLPEDGVINLGFGLGKTIVDGGFSWIYCPKCPNKKPPFGSVTDMLKLTQTEFWSVNMGEPSAYDPIKETEYMLKENIHSAEEDNTLQNLASTYDHATERLTMGTGRDGARVLNFAPLLSLELIPVNDLLKSLMKVCEEKMNSPVEIEFAMTFSQDSSLEKPYRFGLLQVRPMVVNDTDVSLERSELSSEDTVIASEHVLGNGTSSNIQDIVFVKHETFDPANTKLIAKEIAEINTKLLSEKKPYILIGYGRWGSSDHWLGIPVTWSQISGASIIVEASLENMNIEFSQGSHFFHNLTSFKIQYFYLPLSNDFPIDWDWIRSLEHITDLEFVSHVKYDKTLKTIVDGKSRSGVIKK
ncbi:MAG: hypothetical protein PF574_07745 [Candidatus Delongbacteria bacterium]|jgi:hypothetical protein|nr:hypothetical protein [Candidatus Delongbacteria bacterium]